MNIPLTLTAGNNIMIGAAYSSARNEIKGDSSSYKEEMSKSVSSDLSSSGNVNIRSGTNGSGSGSGAGGSGSGSGGSGGSTSIVAGIDTYGHSFERSKSGMSSSTQDKTIIYRQNVNQSSIMAGGDLTINSNNNIIVLGSNLSGTSGSLLSGGDTYIMSLANIDKRYDYHLKTSVDLTALAVQVAVAVAVAAVTAGAGAVAMAAMAGQALTAASTLAIAGAAASNAAWAAAGDVAMNTAMDSSTVQSGKGDTKLSITTKQVGSNLNFTNSLHIDTNDLNLSSSKLNSNSITLDIKNLNIQDAENGTITKTQELKQRPNWRGVVEGGALAGVVAGTTEVVIGGSASYEDAKGLEHVYDYGFNSVLKNHTGLSKLNDFDGIIASKAQLLADKIPWGYGIHVEGKYPGISYIMDKLFSNALELGLTSGSDDTALDSDIKVRNERIDSDMQVDKSEINSKNILINFKP